MIGAALDNIERRIQALDDALAAEIADLTLAGNLDLNGNDIVGSGNINVTGNAAVSGSMSAASGAISGALTVADEAYAAGWNSSLQTPTKNALYDKIESLDAAKQPVNANLTDIAALTTTAAGRSVLTIADPGADRMMAWDDSAGAVVPIAKADITNHTTPADTDAATAYSAAGALIQIAWSLFRPPQYLHVRDLKASGTSGDAITASAWNALVLNDVALNEIAGASLSSNQVTLPAGRYRARFDVPVYAIGSGSNAAAKNYAARLYNVTAAAVVVDSISGQTGQRAGDTHSVVSEVSGDGFFTLSVSSVLQIEFYTSNAVDIGDPASIAGRSEIYTTLVIERRAAA